MEETTIIPVHIGSHDEEWQSTVKELVEDNMADLGLELKYENIRD